MTRKLSTSMLETAVKKNCELGSHARNPLLSIDVGTGLTTALQKAHKNDQNLISRPVEVARSELHARFRGVCDGVQWASGYVTSPRGSAEKRTYRDFFRQERM